MSELLTKAGRDQARIDERAMFERAPAGSRGHCFERALDTCDALEARCEAAEASFGHQERKASGEVIDALRVSLQAKGEALEQARGFAEGLRDKHDPSRRLPWEGL